MDFSKHIPAADSWLIKGAALPKNTSVDSESKDVGEGAQNSAIAVYAAVSGVTLTEGKKISISVKSSKDGTTWRTLHTQDASGTPDGMLMDYVLPPSFEGIVKATVSTDDASAAGTVDVYLGYIPR